MRNPTGTIKRTAAFIVVFAVVFLAFFAFSYAAEAGKGEFINPLRWPTLQEFIAAFLRAVVMIALPFVTLAFVWVGVQYLLAQGKSEDIKQVHAHFMYVVIGALLVMGAWVIATLIAGTVVQLVK